MEFFQSGFLFVSEKRNIKETVKTANRKILEAFQY